MSGQSDGLLLVDKPAGMTSHDVVLFTRRVYGERSIGHLGTLDPFATGLLVLLLGKATRLANFLETDPKVYEATIRFGAETDTDDCTGTVVRETGLPHPNAVREGIAALTGRISQLPPAYSAKSVDGTRAYAAARRGTPIELQPSTVDVSEWIIRAERRDELDVTIHCGSGTYIRALARDLGRLAASSAHLTALRRTKAGQFDISQATTIEEMKSLPPRLRALRVVTSDA